MVSSPKQSEVTAIKQPFEKEVEKIVEVPVYIEVPVTESITVEKIVEVPVYVEKIIEVKVLPRQFQSLSELDEWLKKIQILLISGDCDDFALHLQNRALEDGYLMNFEVIQPDEYGRYFKGQVVSFHAINSVIIGNEFMIRGVP